MAYEQTQMRDIVDRAVNHNWSIPEFQTERALIYKDRLLQNLSAYLTSEVISTPALSRGALVPWTCGDDDMRAVGSNAKLAGVACCPQPGGYRYFASRNEINSRL